MKQFKGLLKSEIKKAEAFANKLNRVDDCKVTAYSYSYNGTDDFISVECEICRNYDDVAEYGVAIEVFMPDRRRSWARVKSGDYLEAIEKGLVKSISEVA